MTQQPAFDVEQKAAVLAGEATQSAIGGDHPMAGHDERERIGAAGLANGARRIA